MLPFHGFVARQAQDGKRSPSKLERHLKVPMRCTSLRCSILHVLMAFAVFFKTRPKITDENWALQGQVLPQLSDQ
jgi:hypothetical protein